MEADIGWTTRQEDTSIDDDISWSTTEEAALSVEEEDAIVTLVIVVIGVIVAIVVLFSMGIFMDCRHQKSDSLKKKGVLKLKIPPFGRKRTRREDGKSLAADMCPNATSEPGTGTPYGNAIV